MQKTKTKGLIMLSFNELRLGKRVTITTPNGEARGVITNLPIKGVDTPKWFRIEGGITMMQVRKYPSSSPQWEVISGELTRKESSLLTRHFL